MPSDAGSALFRAIADFSRLRKEAKQAKRDLKGLKDETGSTDEKLKDTEKSSEKTSRSLGKLGKAVSSARKKLDELERSRAAKTLDNIGDSTKRLLGTLLSIGAGVAKVSLLATVATAALGPVMSLVGAIGALSGVVGVLPGLLAAGGLAAGAMKLAFSGVGDVMKAIAAQDAKAFDEAIKGMPPSMQEAMRAAYKLGPAFDSMKKGVQSAFWQGLGKEISEVGQKYLPMVANAMVAVARSANGAAKEVAAFLKSKAGMDSWKAGLDNVSKAFGNLKGLGTSVARIFTDLFAVSSEFLPNMAKGISDAAKRFADFISEARKDGSLKEWIQTGIDQFKALMGTLKNLGSIVASVFKASAEAGAGFFKTLEQLTGKLAEFLKSAEGQESLKKLFEAIGRAAAVVWPIIRQLVTSLSDVIPILVKIGEKLGPGVQKVIEGIGKAFVEAEPGLMKLADALGRFLTALGDAGPLIGELVNGLADVLTPVIDAITKVIEWLTKAFNSLPEPMQDVIGKLGGAAVAGGLAVVAFNKVLGVAKSFVGAFDNAAGAIGRAVSKLTDWIGLSKKAKAADVAADVADDVDVATGGKDGKKGADGKKKGGSKAGALGKVGGAIAGGLALGEVYDQYQEATPVGPGWVGQKLPAPEEGQNQGDVAREVVQTGLDIQNALSGIGKAFDWFKQKNGEVRAFVIESWNAIRAHFTAVWNSIWALATTIWNGVKNTIVNALLGVGQFFLTVGQTIWTTLTNAWNTVKEVAVTIWNSIVEFFRTTWQAILDIFVSVGTAIRDAVVAAWTFIKDTASAIWNGIVEFFRGIWEVIKGLFTGNVDQVKQGLSQAWNAIKDTAVAVWNAIKSFIGTIWDGIKSVVSTVVNSIKSIVEGAWNAISSITSSIWNGIKGVVSSVWNGIKDIVGGAVDWVQNRIQDLMNIAGKVGSAIGGAVKAIIPGMAKGGWVGGSGRGDTQVRALDPREFVMNPKASKRWGPVLERMNAATGGTSGVMPQDLVNGAAGVGSSFASKLSSGLDVAASARSGAGKVPAFAGARQVGDVHVTQIVKNPLPEKPSVTLSKRVGRLTSLGLQDALSKN